MAERGFVVTELTACADTLAQIKEKEYAAALRSHNLPIYGIGLLFDNATHTLIDYAAEEL